MNDVVSSQAPRVRRPGYRLGIDLGTTFTTAAVVRTGPHGADRPEVAPLGDRSAAVPSVLYFAPDGSVLVGEAAERRELAEPDRVVRRFKRRIGDDVPLVVGGTVHSPQDLAARLARWVVDRVAEREGGPAERVALTHPASWGTHKRDLLTAALRTVGLGGIALLTEPQAAATSYAARERIAAGGAVAVYDLGGGTFDAAVVRVRGGSSGPGFDLPGRPVGIDTLGGADFDDRILDHVRSGLGASFDALDPDDPDVVSAVARLRRECVEAKEALSADTEVTIPVLLPGLRTNSRLVRTEFEAMIRGSLDHTVEALRSAVGSAGLTPAALQAVLLVGGSSRIPLVSRLVSEGLGRPVAVDADPKTSIALGAVLSLAPRPSSAPAPAATSLLPGSAAAVTSLVPGSRANAPTTVTPSQPRPVVPVRPARAVDAEEGAAPDRSDAAGRSRTRTVLALAGVVAVAAVVTGLLLLPGPSSTTPSGPAPGAVPAASTGPAAPEGATDGTTSGSGGEEGASGSAGGAAPDEPAGDAPAPPAPGPAAPGGGAPAPAPVGPAPAGPAPAPVRPAPAPAPREEPAAPAPEAPRSATEPTTTSEAPPAG